MGKFIMELSNDLEKSKIYDLSVRAKIILKDVFEENFLSLNQVIDADYDEAFDIVKLYDRDKSFNLFIKENEEIPKVAYASFDEDSIFLNCIKYDFINRKNDLDSVKDEDIKLAVKKALDDICYEVSL
jgi:hypothetical protein